MINKKCNFMLQAACLALATAMCLGLSGCGRLAKEDQGKSQSDRLIGAAVWLERGELEHAEPPEAGSIGVKWVKDDNGEKKLQFSSADMMAVYVAAEWKDGELVSAAMEADDRFEQAPWHASCGSGAGYDCEATLYFDSKLKFTAFLYKIYEKPDGSLYAEQSEGFRFGEAGGANCVEEENSDWRVKVTVNYEPFETCDKMVVKQFDRNDVCISRKSFSPDDDVELNKAAGCAYAVCEYIKGSQAEYRLVEDDTVFRVVINPDTGIGEKRNIELK